MEEPITPEGRTARIRSLARAPRPRITYADLAERAGYAESYVKLLLSDNANTGDVGPALDRLEAALAEILDERRTAPDTGAPDLIPGLRRPTRPSQPPAPRP